MSNNVKEGCCIGGTILAIVVIFTVTLGLAIVCPVERYEVERTKIEAEARVQVAHEIQVGLTNIGKWWAD